MITRRGLLSTAASLTALAGVPTVLSACSGPAGPGSDGGSTGTVDLPTQVEVEAAPAGLPGTAQGVQPAYFRYPTAATQTVPSPPGSGKPRRSMVVTYATPPKNCAT